MRGLANTLLGTTVRPSLAAPGSGGYWHRGGNVLRDRAFWNQQGYLLTRLTVGFGVALAEWTLLAASLGLLTSPIWYRRPGLVLEFARRHGVDPACSTLVGTSNAHRALAATLGASFVTPQQQ